MRIIKFMGSYLFTYYALSLFVVLVILGTLLQATYGIDTADKVIFKSWFTLLNGTIPLPGLKSISFLLFVNIVTGFFIQPTRTLLNTRSILLHCGILLFLMSIIVNTPSEKKYLTIRENVSCQKADLYNNTPKPFDISLVRLDIQYYPGTQNFNSCVNTITVKKNGTTHSGIVALNRPFNFEGYRIFQASFDLSSTGEKTSTFRIVKKSFFEIPIIAGAAVCLGLVLQCFVSFRKVSRGEL